MSLLQDFPTSGCGSQGLADGPRGPGELRGVSALTTMQGFLSCSRPRGSWTWRALNLAHPKGRAGHWHRSPAPGVSDVGGVRWGRESQGEQTPLLFPLRNMSPLALLPVTFSPYPTLRREGGRGSAQ